MSEIWIGYIPTDAVMPHRPDAGTHHHPGIPSTTPYHHAVLLPELYEPAREEARARLRWNPDGLLALRSIDPDEAR